ncbi:hypothetical protein VTO73DRAFT_14716 [Trametes versicolor]
MSFLGGVDPADIATQRAASRSLRKASELVKIQQYERSVPYFVDALQDYWTVDAVLQWAWRFPNKELALQLTEITEAKARAHLLQALGSDCFGESYYGYGEFWGLSDTRPYMRALGAIAHLAHRLGDYDKSIAASTEALRLCHGDNMGQRYILSSILLKAGRFADALSFCQVWLDPQYDGLNRPRGGCTFDPPNPEPLTPRLVEWHSKPWSPGDLLLNAAYAAFALWGDCELARQYLVLGTRANPGIFVKVLARREKPDGPYSRPRTTNGSDEAHDYRWLTQDLWAEPEAWVWINTNRDLIDIVVKTCTREGCGRREMRPLDFKKCGGCRQAFYCGPECQREDWQAHRQACRQANAPPARPDSPVFATSAFLNNPAALHAMTLDTSDDSSDLSDLWEDGVEVEPY